mgnify:CR=1 FL=1
MTDAYGSTEGGISIGRTPDTPDNALGVGQEGTKILDPETRQECPPARFDEHGRLLNAEDAVGEIVNVKSASSFEGYWKNSEALEERTHAGIYWTWFGGTSQFEEGYVAQKSVEAGEHPQLPHYRAGAG